MSAHHTCSFPIYPYGATYQEMAAGFGEILDIFLFSVKIRTTDPGHEFCTIILRVRLAESPARLILALIRTRQRIGAPERI